MPEKLPDFAFMGEMGWLMLWGTFLLFLDSILIVLLYERSAAWFGDHLTPRILLSAAVALTFDQIGFFAALRVFAGVPESVLFGGWIAKMVAVLFYGSLAGLYLRYFEAKTRVPMLVFSAI